MKLAREHLSLLLNALYDVEGQRFTVSHPSDEVGSLIEIELGDPGESSIHVATDVGAYTVARTEVERTYGSPAVDELPAPGSYLNAFVAGGALDLENSGEIDEFVDRYGYRDLNAGHRPVAAGFDTNLLPWRIADVLELDPYADGEADRPPINGYAMATGVLEELDWDYKRENTDPLEDAFGPAFDRLWNQPAGANREGRLGENYYRRLRDRSYADEVVCDPGDESIVAGYDEFQRDGRKDVILFSNDRNFIERARARRVPAQRVEFPADLPATITTSWPAIRDTLYVLTVLFGVLELPKVTLYGVWTSKTGQDWHQERLTLDCRSPKVRGAIERDTKIIDTYDS